MEDMEDQVSRIVSVLVAIVVFFINVSLASAQDLPRLRGANVHIGWMQKEDVARMASWGVNLLRINFDMDKSFLGMSLGEDPLRPYRNNLGKLDTVLAECDKYGIKVCLSASGIFGRPKGNKESFSYEEHLVDFWQIMSARYKTNRTVVMLDLLNEPHPDSDGIRYWQNKLMRRLVSEIRKINPDIWIVVEPGPMGLPQGFKSLVPLKDSHIIYSFHHYAPHNYTHQGVRGAPTGLVYPGRLRMFDASLEISWNKSQLRKSLQPAIDFQKKYGVRIYVGEFGVIRWASGAAQWLQDSIDIFEELGWDYSFHSLVGWNGWNPTFDPNEPTSGESYGGKETGSLKKLKEAWAKNKAVRLPLNNH